MAIKPVGYYTYGGSVFSPPKTQVKKPGGAAPSALPGGGGAPVDSLGITTIPGRTLGTSALPPSSSLGGGPITTTTVRAPLQTYQDEILSDPQAQGALGTYNATLDQLAQTRRDQFRQALITSGYNPGTLTGSLAGYAGDITQQDIDAANANQLSSRAQLNQWRDQAMKDLPYLLAARGMGRSGAFATGQSAIGRQYDVQAQQGLDDLLKAFGGYASNYATGASGAASTLDAARAAVAQRLAQQAGYSESVTTSGGDEGGGPPPEESSYPDTYYPTAGSPMSTTDYGTARAIASILGPKPKKIPSNIFQIARNVRAG